MSDRKRIRRTLLWMGFVSLMLCSGLTAQVNRAFVNRYNGPGNAEDEALAMKMDADGNIYVTGRSAGDGTGIDFFTIKYSPDGKELWSRRYDGPAHGEDSARALAIDAQGNVYVTGESLSDDTNMDFATIKYSPDGDELWVRRYDGPDHLEDYAVAVAIDSQGRVYVTGFSNTLTTNFDYATVAYDRDGNQLWVQRFDGQDHGKDIPTAIAVDSQNNVYVTGSSDNEETHNDYLTIKYSSDGTLLWMQVYDGPEHDEDFPKAMVIDADDNCYITGKSTGLSTNFDIATIKYAPDGTPLWVARFNNNGERIEDNAGRALAVDAQGFVYVTGSTVQNSRSDYATIKYAPGGTEVWSKLYRGPAYGNHIATAIGLDGQGNVYVTGRSQGDHTGLDYATIKYNANGVLQWLDRYNGPANSDDGANALVIDADGNVYVTGADIGVGTGLDYATIKYTQP